MADDTDDSMERDSSYAGRGGFELKKAIVLQQFNLKAAKFAESLIGKPWDQDACELGLQDLATQVFEHSKPTLKTLPADVHIERDLGSTEVWEVVSDGPRRPPCDSVRYQQNPELFPAEQLEIWRMLQVGVQRQLESLQESQCESDHFSVPAVPSPDDPNGANGFEPPGFPLNDELSLANRLQEAEKISDPKLRGMYKAVTRYRWYLEELRSLKVASKKYQTPELLYERFPKFELWKVLESTDRVDIAAGDFNPGRFSWSLVKRLIGLKGSDDRTLKNYRRALRIAHISF